MVQKNTAPSFIGIISNLSPLVQVSCFFPAELEKHANFLMWINKDKENLSNIILLDT